jgi:hypothetical protein
MRRILLTRSATIMSGAARRSGKKSPPRVSKGVMPEAGSPLSVELDARLLGWLERRAAHGRAPRPDLEAAAVITVADGAVAAVERVCHRWGLRTRLVPRDGGSCAVLRIDGPALPVLGLTELARSR